MLTVLSVDVDASNNPDDINLKMGLALLEPWRFVMTMFSPR